MGRLQEIIGFIEYDHERGVIIEPEKRLDKLRDSILDVIKTYNPGVIVKAGLGSGRLLHEIALNSSAYIAVVEPSMAIIRAFIESHREDEAASRIHFINGEFNGFPVDYYAADLLISADYLDFLESGTVVDEFRRATQFEGILVLSGTVLHDEDLDGIYDDFMKEAFPLHNDYYLRDDLRTFMDLNEFSFIKGHMEYYPADLAALAAHLAPFRPAESADPMHIVEEHRERLTNLYALNGTEISEPYYIGVYTRRKPAMQQGS
jgi:SAM-dependent methyltransferase